MALIQLRRETFVAPTLQITAMMDMFTIIVFFLLFSYSEKPEEVDLDPDLTLPSSIAQKQYDNTLQLFLSKNRLKIEDKLVAELQGETLQGFDADKPEESQLYLGLKERFVKMQQDKAALNATLGLESEQKDSAHLLFYCDRDIPFKTINQIIQTAAMAGFPNFQFAVMEK